MRDFHIYLEDGVLKVVMDPADPQRADILDAVSSVMNKAKRSREADECLHAKDWK